MATWATVGKKPIGMTKRQHDSLQNPHQTKIPAFMKQAQDNWVAVKELK